MEYEYFEIEFDNGETAFIEEISLEKAREAAEKIGNCHLTGQVFDQDEAFAEGCDIY